MLKFDRSLIPVFNFVYDSFDSLCDEDVCIFQSILTCKGDIELSDHEVEILVIDLEVALRYMNTAYRYYSAVLGIYNHLRKYLIEVGIYE